MLKISRMFVFRILPNFENNIKKETWDLYSDAYVVVNINVLRKAELLIFVFRNSDTCTWLTNYHTCCKFPFHYLRTEYYSCTSHDSDSYWCRDGDIDSDYGICQGKVQFKTPICSIISDNFQNNKRRETAKIGF